MKVKVFTVSLAIMGWLAMPFSNVLAGQLEDRVSALETAVAALQTTVAAQQVTIDSLQSQLTAVQANSALELGPYVSVDQSEINGVTGPHVIFDGVNVHVRSGAGEAVGSGNPSFNSPNGLGNLIVGYNEVYGTLNPGDRGGSHNLVIGYGNKFPSLWGFVHGWGNAALDGYAATVGGNSSSAGEFAVVIGGDNNNAAGSESVCIGGNEHNALGLRSVIVGGSSNTTETTGHESVVSGGFNNVASGFQSKVSGGYSNTASGSHSSVSGGNGRQALGADDWAAGSLFEDY